MTSEINFSSSPYFDDYNEDENYHKILYRPGYAVQTRELNQSQSIFQKQIERFANHVFENGSMVSPGNIKLDTSYRYIKIYTNYQDGSEETIGNELSNFVGYILKNSGNTLRAKVVNYIKVTSAVVPYITLYLSYSGNDSSNGITEAFTSDDVLTFIESNRQIKVLESGIGSAAHIAEGVYYVNGYFVKNSAQTVILDPYSTTPTYSVGFNIIENIITPEENSDLYDNAFGTDNYSAPGAHRFQIYLSLTKYEIDSETYDLISTQDSTKYIQLLKVVNGEIYNIVDRSNYSVLEETFARRTYDESGDYVVDSFDPSFHEHKNNGSNSGYYLNGDEDKFVISLDGGKAYVRGYEISTYNQTILSSRKARGADHLLTNNNSAVGTSYGSYILIDFDEPTSIIPSLSNYPLVDIKDNSANTVGTLRIRSIIPYQSYYKCYVFDINMNVGKNFSSDSKRLFLTQTTQNFDVDIVNDTSADEDTPISLYDINNNLYIFKIENSPVYSILDVNYVTLESFDSGASSGQVSISTGQSNRTFTTDGIIISNITDGGILTSGQYSLALTSGSTQLNITGSGIVNGKTYRVILPVINVSISNNTAFKLRSKSLQTGTFTVSPPSSAPSYISLGKADIVSVEVLDANSNDITYKWRLDNGQRDNFYDIGKIILNSGENVTYPITVNYEYFSHGSGDYFAANSYPSDMYDSIPIFNSSNGDQIDLTNALDFRPVKSASNDFTGVGSLSGSYTHPNGTFFSDISFYIGRIDKIVLSSSGKFSIVEGIPSTNPVAPKDIEDAITLHNVIIPPYTYDIKDIRVKSNSYKRYRMSDISSLETRIGNLEYYTSLTLLEKSTSDLTIQDENGYDKFKNGFFVDPFTSQSAGGIQNPDFKAAIDLETGECRPLSSTKVVKFDFQDGSNTVKVGDLILLSYQEKNEITQTLYSSDAVVNPFSVFSWLGNIALSPSNDTWFSTERSPDIIIDGGTVDSIAYQNQKDSVGTVWNSWQTLWTGSTVTTSDVWRANGGTGHRFVTETTTNTSIQKRTGVETSAISRIETKTINSRVIAQAIVPWIRSRLVSFEASLLKPNTLHYCFFGERDVTDYCQQLTPTVRALGTGILTDSSGKASGTFLIPNTDELKFASGTQVFKLYNRNDLSDSSGDSSGKATYTAKGILSTEQSTVISTRVNDIQTIQISEDRTVVNSISSRNIQVGDPLAQSFFVTLDGGMFITSIEIPFTSKDSNVPVTLQLREMSNGSPTMSILPFGVKTLYPSDIIVNTTSPVYTKFTFDSPVYVQNGFEYCFVIMTNSDEYKVFKASLGENDLITGQPIVKQPYIGVMFKSQNNSTWTEDQLSDLTFKINRAKFSTDVGTVTFNENTPISDVGKEADPFISFLDTNPFVTLNGTNIIKVLHQNHGFVAGDIVSINTPTNTGTSNNIANSLLTDDFVVLNPQIDYYFIEVGSVNANASGKIGGAGVTASNIVSYDVAQFYSNTIQPTGTNIGWSVSMTNKATTSSRALSVPTQITINENLFLNYSNSVIKGEDDTIVYATLVTNTDNISPVIDVAYQCGYFTSNKINNVESTIPSYNGFAIYISEVENISSSSAKYISKPISLINPSTSIRIYVDSVRYPDSILEVWYKTLNINSSEDMNSIPYTKMDIIEYPSVSQNDSDYKEYVFDVDNLDQFQSFIFKIVMRSNNTAFPIKLKSLRAIALA